MDADSVVQPAGADGETDHGIDGGSGGTAASQPPLPLTEGYGAARSERRASNDDLLSRARVG